MEVSLFHVSLGAGLEAEPRTRAMSGGGALGHPKVFINLDRGVKACGYWCVVSFCATRLDTCAALVANLLLLVILVLTAEYDSTATTLYTTTTRCQATRRQRDCVWCVISEDLEGS